MTEHKPLYRYSLAYAAQYREKELWRESHQENCDCARAIEQSIRENYDGERLGAHLAELVIKRYGFDRVNWVLANTVQQNPRDGRFRPENRQWAASFFIPKSSHNQEYCVNAHPGLTDLFIQQTKETWNGLHLWDHSHCEEGKQDYTDQVVVLHPSVLKDQYKTPEDQLFLAEGGFGCSPTASGQKIFGTFLKDGEETHFCRSDFIGVLKEEYLPDWAKEKLEAMDMEKAEEKLSPDGMNMQ